MRTLDTEQLKNLMLDFKRNLVFCPNEEHWLISDDRYDDDCLKRVELDAKAAFSLDAWVKDKVIVAYSSGEPSSEMEKIYFDAWRSVQAYGKQPHEGYLKASKYGLQCNTEHYDNEAKQMPECRIRLI